MQDRDGAGEGTQQKTGAVHRSSVPTGKAASKPAARQLINRQCKLCGRFAAGVKECPRCGNPLVRRRWRMTKARIRYIHALAAEKGLITRHDDELYRLQLQAVGVASCKELTAPQFNRLVSWMKRLPTI